MNVVNACLLQAHFFRQNDIPTMQRGLNQYYMGGVDAIVVEHPLYDLFIGNIDGARYPNDPGSAWSPLIGGSKLYAAAAKTHARQAKKESSFSPI